MRKFDGNRPAAAIRCALSVLLLSASVLTTRAQDEAGAAAGPQQGGAPGRQGSARRDDAAGLLMQLNLSPEQRAQLIEIRTQSAAEGQALGRRLNQARRALDAAIYADNIDEAVIEERAREVAAALSAVMRTRALTELRVRRVLTPEQLDLFRQLRREASRRQRFERRSRRGGAGGGQPRRERPLFDDRPNRRPNGPADNPPPGPARLRRPQP
jgi:Spy/CpxP family protein refolding chaperone